MPKRMIHAGKRMRRLGLKESYPDYLRRVASDYRDSGYENTPKDYEESAQLIEDLARVLKSLVGDMHPADAHKRMYLELLKRVS